MLKYRNRVKRKQFILTTSRNAKKYIRNVVDKVTDIIEKERTLYTTISNEIKQALDWGMPEVRIYLYNDEHCLASIESYYQEYHKESAEDINYESIFDVMVDVILPNKFSLYSDILIETNEDHYGKYFDIKLVN